MTQPVDRANVNRWLILLATGAIVLALAVLFVVQLAQPTAGVPVSGPSKPGPNSNSGVDLECGAGAECGPDNPAVRVAPSPVIGPKIIP